MERGILLSEKYGVNPTIPVCFWCGNRRNEVVMLGKQILNGEEFEAPMQMCIDYRPCEECMRNFKKGFVFFEATTSPNSTGKVPIQDGIYPTGRYMVFSKEYVKDIGIDTSKGAAFLDPEVFEKFTPKNIVE